MGTEAYCLTCSRHVGAHGRICAACAYVPPKSKILPKHGLDGGEWIPNARGILEYRIVPPKPKPVVVWPPLKPPKLCIVCEGSLPAYKRSYCSDPCRIKGEAQRRAKWKERNGITPGLVGRHRKPDTRVYTFAEMRAADNAYKKGDRSDWANEGRRQYRRTRKDAA